MKTRERKQEDLNALTEQLGNSKSAMIVPMPVLRIPSTVERQVNEGAGAMTSGRRFQVAVDCMLTDSITTPLMTAN